MKAIVIHDHGGIDKLLYENVDTPRLGFGEVLVKVRAAGINHFDHDIREGVSGIVHQMPHVLGLEAAGDIVELGEGVEGFKVGDRVAPTFMLSDWTCRNCMAGRDNLCPNGGALGVTTWGSYAECVKVPQRCLIALPDPLSYNDAAASLVTMGTAWQMLVSQAKILPGEDILINGAGGGIGTAAIQIAKLAGGRVIASAGSYSKLDRTRTLGADETINYQEQNLADEVLRLTGGRGVDVIVESIGGDILLQSLNVLALGGRLVTCGAHAGENVQLNVINFFRKQIAMYGTHGAPKSEIAKVFDLVAQDKLKPVIQQAFPLAEARQAHRIIDDRGVFGKLILNPFA
jgi:NADPH:quinone reductase-like Zn-dependent oxidoreductase